MMGNNEVMDIEVLQRLLNPLGELLNLLLEVGKYQINILGKVIAVLSFNSISFLSDM